MSLLSCKMVVASIFLRRLKPCSSLFFNPEWRSFRTLRSLIAERMSNKFDFQRVAVLGPDFACLEWLMQCGSTKVEMSDGKTITSISEMICYIKGFGFDVRHLPLSDKPKNSLCTDEELKSEALYNARWPDIPKPYIVKVDASDSAITDSGFLYFRECRGIEELKLNFCDYFGDDALRVLSLGRAALTLRNLEIVMNPCISDASVFWLVRMKALRRIHFYFLPYVVNQAGVLRQLRVALPKCKVTFPVVNKVGYGYEEK